MIALCLILAILVAGCAVETSVLITTNSIPASTNGESGATLPIQLALGTLNLEGTQQAVTAEQAADLLPLWKAVKSLSSSDNITTVEINAVYKQIQGVMTAEQLDAIQSIDLSSQKMTKLAGRYGVILSGTGPQAPISAQQSLAESSVSAGQPSEGLVMDTGSGAVPGAMDLAGGGAPPDAGAQSTMNVIDQTSYQGAPGSSSTLLYEAVVDLLEGLIVE